MSLSGMKQVLIICLYLTIYDRIYTKCMLMFHNAFNQGDESRRKSLEFNNIVVKGYFKKKVKIKHKLIFKVPYCP